MTRYENVITGVFSRLLSTLVKLNKRTSKRSKSDRKSATSSGGSNSFHPTMMGVLAFFALLKIMVTYISFNEGNHRFLLPSLCAQSFVSNKINVAPKQWMLALYQSTRHGERKKELGRSNAHEERRKQRRESKRATGRWYLPSSSWRPNRRRDSTS